MELGRVPGPEAGGGMTGPLLVRPRPGGGRYPEAVATRFFTTRAPDGTASAVARVRGLQDADRLTRTGGPDWEARPDLDRLVFLDPDMNWDEVDAAGARKFAAEMGYSTKLVGAAPAKSPARA